MFVVERGGRWARSAQTSPRVRSKDLRPHKSQEKRAVKRRLFGPGVEPDAWDVYREIAKAEKADLVLI